MSKRFRTHEALSRTALLFSICLFGACSVTRNVPEGSYLLKKVKIDLPDDSPIDKGEMASIVKQKPNRKIGGFIPFYTWVYNYAVARQKRKGDGKANEWLKNTVGEAPVILDQALKKRSIEQLKQYLVNRGYFNGWVEDSVDYRSNKKAIVHYRAFPREVYTIKNISYSTSDTGIVGKLRTISRETYLKPGNACDLDAFSRERKRMASALKDLGYYQFNEQYVRFELDSLPSNKKVNIGIFIDPPATQGKSTDEQTVAEKPSHKTFTVRNIYVNLKHSTPTQDFRADTSFFEGVYFISNGYSKYRLGSIHRNIEIKPHVRYKLSDVQATQGRLATLGIFKYIDIQMVESPSADSIDCIIQLQSFSKQAISIETEGTHRAGNLGIAANLVYGNKSVFKGMERLELKLSGAVEGQRTQTTRPVFELGPSLSIYFPSLLFFKDREDLKIGKTQLTSLYNVQNRRDFDREVASVSFGFIFEKINSYLSHKITPIDLNVIRINRDTAFERRLFASNNSLLINSYSDHFITASQYTLTYNSQKKGQDRNFIFFRMTLEGAGSTLRLFHSLIGAETGDDDSYSAFRIRYAQYIRSEMDLRFYYVLNKHSRMIYRLYQGTGVALKNLNTLPFEKSFYGGGANGIRAFAARTLGPGSMPYDLINNIDQIGDLKIEGNAEYRFDITSIIEGALFMDVGNIWLLKSDERRPNAEFKINTLFQQLAIGSGLGARFDFNFFLIRLDVGVPLKLPSLPGGEQWIFQSKDEFMAERSELPQLYRPVFNLGIGYPF